MLSFERAAELEVKGSIPAKLKQPAFATKDALWQKENHNPNFQPSQVTSKRHEFIKIGKTFGFEITRYLTFFKGHLLYYDVPLGGSRVSRTWSSRATVTCKMCMCSGWHWPTASTCSTSPTGRR